MCGIGKDEEAFSKKKIEFMSDSNSAGIGKRLHVKNFSNVLQKMSVSFIS